MLVAMFFFPGFVERGALPMKPTRIARISEEVVHRLDNVTPVSGDDNSVEPEDPADEFLFRERNSSKICGIPAAHASRPRVPVQGLNFCLQRS